MASTQWSTRRPQIVQEDTPSGNSLEKAGSGSVTAREPVLGALRKATSKQKGKRPEKRRKTGKHPMLPDVPLGILYVVSTRISPDGDDGTGDNLLGVVDILSRPPDGSTANFVGQQVLP